MKELPTELRVGCSWSGELGLLAGRLMAPKIRRLIMIATWEAHEISTHAKRNGGLTFWDGDNDFIHLFKSVIYISSLKKRLVVDSSRNNLF